MKIDNVKLANSVRVGPHELTYFKTTDDRDKLRYEIDLQDHLIKVTDLKTGATKYTSLYNTVSFDMVKDESKATKSDGPTGASAQGDGAKRARGNKGAD